MVRKGKWKLIVHALQDSEELLFDLETDPGELNNLRDKHPEIAAELKALVNKNWKPKQLLKKYLTKKQHHHLLSAWTEVVHPDESEPWEFTKKAVGPTVG